jgi:ABC-type polysaccharide/polyol phosphate export permease
MAISDTKPTMQTRPEASSSGEVRDDRPAGDVRVFVPDGALRAGYGRLMCDVARELADARFLIAQLARRDLLAFHKQSLLGALWVFFVPATTVATFVLLRSSGVVTSVDVGAPYPVYAVLGIAFYQLFAQGVVAGAGSLVAGGEMVSRINLSKKALVIASIARPLVSFAIVMVLLAALLSYYAVTGAYRPPLAAASLLAPLAVVPIVLLTLGCAFVTALLHAVVRDVGALLGVALTFLMLLTPVLYPRPVVTIQDGPSVRLLDTITEYNPLYHLVAAPRDLVLRGEVTDAWGFATASALAALVFVLAVVVFHLTEARIAERI